MSMPYISRLHNGTSGWSYNHWYGVYYPESIKPAKFLEHYITTFLCVELNSSFYHLPNDKTVEGWVHRTPASFRFCPKLSRFITHQKRLMNVEDALGKYFEVFNEMKNRLGPVLIQLPPGLTYNRALIKDFLNLLNDQQDDYRFAIEVRHRSWISAEFFQLLSDNNVGFVIADSGGRFPYHEAVTADFVYLRFHGKEKLYASDYKDTELIQYAEKIIRWLSDNKEVWVFFNNDFHGYAVKNSLKLREIILKSTEVVR
jgi:uncharacterized protein YecE (DUF72 family)